MSFRVFVGCAFGQICDIKRCLFFIQVTNVLHKIMKILKMDTESIDLLLYALRALLPEVNYRQSTLLSNSY